MEAGMKKYINRVECIVDLGCISANIDSICAGLPEGTKVCAVVKADAYGHGAVAVSRYLKDRVDFFAVATAGEAMELRESGVNNPILILGYVWPEDYPELIRALAAKAEGKAALVHIKIDTGMNRIGFRPDEAAADIVRDICRTDGLNVEGIFTHFARADEADKAYAMSQLKFFKDFISMVEKDGISIPIHHCANSAASMELPDATMDMVRLGIAMYGYYPSNEVSHDIELRPAMSITSTIVFIKDVPAGSGISYNHTHILDRPCRVATIPVGYGDGYPRLLSDICGIFNYEFLCRLSLRIPRLYV